MVDFEDIENAMKTAIASLNRPYIREITSFGGKLVRAYSGQFEDAASYDIDYAIRSDPAVWVTFAGSGQPERMGARKYKLPLIFLTFVSARSLRNEETARHGVKLGNSMVSVGTYQLLRDVMAALLGKKLELNIEPFVMGGIDTVYNKRDADRATSVMVQRWYTSVIVPVPEEGEDAAPWIERVNLEYFFDDASVAVTDLIPVDHVTPSQS